jgi:hypothetical protein
MSRTGFQKLISLLNSEVHAETTLSSPTEAANAFALARSAKIMDTATHIRPRRRDVDHRLFTI